MTFIVQLTCKTVTTLVWLNYADGHDVLHHHNALDTAVYMDKLFNITLGVDVNVAP